MAALLILLTVVDEGLGALYFGIVPEAVGPFREAFGVPDDHEPIGAIAIGHNAEAAPRDLRARRRPAQDVIHYGRWRGAALCLGAFSRREGGQQLVADVRGGDTGDLGVIIGGRDLHDIGADEVEPGEGTQRGE
jgi:hypothetical protein